MSPRSTTRPLHFWCFASNSAFFKWHLPYWGKMNCSALRPCFYFWLSSGSTPKFSPIFPIPCPPLPLLQGIFMAWSIRINLCTKLWCCSELSLFPAIWSSWYFGRDSSIRILVDSLAFQDARKFRSEINSLATGLSMLVFLASLARHCGSQWRFQFLASILDGIFECLVLRVNEINSPRNFLA